MMPTRTQPSPNETKDVPNVTGLPHSKAPDARLLPALRALTQTAGSTDKVFEQLFDVIIAEFEPLVGRCDYRSGATTKTKFRHRATLRKDDAQRLADEHLADAIVDVQCSGANGPRIDSHQLGKMQLHTVAVPVLDLQSGEAEGAVGVLIDGSPDQAATVAQQLMTLGTVATSMQGAAQASTSSPKDIAAANNREQQLDGLSRASTFSSVREFAYSLVNSIGSRFHCEQVAFGSVIRQRVEVLAVSGLAEIKPNSPGVISIRQAMEECLDRADTVGWQLDMQQTTADGQRQDVCLVGLLHRQWGQECQQSSVISLPLKIDDEIVGVISLRRDTKHPFTTADRASLEQVGGQFARPVRLIDNASRPITKQIKTAIGGAARSSMKRGAWGRWVLLVGFLSAAGWFFAGTTQFQPRCACEVAPESTLHFTAPFQSKLEQVHVTAGEDVTAGALLAQFETRDLRLEYESLAADLTAREVDVRKALQENDVEKAALYQAQADVLRTQALAVKTRLERAKIFAPADGRIVQCDSAKLTGQMLSQGDPILQFAPHGGFVLKIHVPDEIATSVKPGQTGVFASAARPDMALQFRIRQMNSAAEVINGANVFVAEAELTERPDWLKAGMQGNVRIDGDDRPVWWVGTHSLLGWMRMRFWL